MERAAAWVERVAQLKAEVARSFNALEVLSAELHASGGAARNSSEDGAGSGSEDVSTPQGESPPGGDVEARGVAGFVNDTVGTGSAGESADTEGADKGGASASEIAP